MLRADEQGTLTDVCIYCGKDNGPLTRDHVPPKCLFPKPRAEMITVPACLECNKSYEKDDVLFAVATCVDAYIDHPQATRAWETSLRPLIRKSPGFRAMLSSNLLPGRVRTPGGVYLPDRRAIRFSKARVTRVVERIVRGLLWHHYKMIVDGETEFEVYRNPSVDPEVAEIINSYTASSWIGGDIFRYRHGLATDGPDSSIWAMQFYACSEYMVVVQGKSFREGLQSREA